MYVDVKAAILQQLLEVEKGGRVFECIWNLPLVSSGEKLQYFGRIIFSIGPAWRGERRPGIRVHVILICIIVNARVPPLAVVS